MTLERITTDRLVLRAWGDDDAAALYAVLSHDEVWPWLGASPRPCPDVESAARTVTGWNELAAGPLGVWAIQVAAAGPASTEPATTGPATTGLAATAGGPGWPQPCGSALLLPLPRSDGQATDAVEIGWHLHPSSWRRGVATEAAQALVARARAAGLPRLHAVVRGGNERSLRVCDRLGMTRLGPTHEWYGTEFVDHVLEL